MIELINTRFRSCIRHNDGGSTFLGYLYAEVVSPGGFTVGMPDLKVRLTREGKPHIAFPSDVKTVKGKEERYPRYFTATAESRIELTNAVFALPQIHATVAQAVVERAA